MKCHNYHLKLLNSFFCISTFCWHSLSNIIWFDNKDVLIKYCKRRCIVDFAHMFSIGAFWNVAFFTQYVYTDLEHGKNESYLVVCLLHDEEFTKQ